MNIARICFAFANLLASLLWFLVNLAQLQEYQTGSVKAADWVTGGIWALCSLWLVLSLLICYLALRRKTVWYFYIPEAFLIVINLILLILPVHNVVTGLRN